jgi:two-component system sensor histidine kinase CpxA
MKLSVKILLLAAMNLLLLVGIAAVFLRLPARLSWDSLVLEPSEDRILSSVRLLALDLQRTPLSQREALLDRLRQNFGADIYLFENDGQQLAGKPILLPEAVIAAMGLGDRPPPPDDFLRAAPSDPPQSGILPTNPLFHLKAGQPTRQWVGVHIPIGSPLTQQLTPGVVFLVTDSWFSSSLFFDFRPWLAAIAAAFLATLLCWAPFLRGLTRSIRKLTTAAEQIAEGRFDVELREPRFDELGQLSQAIQRMAAGLAQLVHGQKRFLGDVAHELCSPMARIQFALGILEQRVPEAQLADLHEDVQHMSSLVQELLQFSKASIQQSAAPLEIVNLQQVALAAAERESVAVQMYIDPSLAAHADPAALSRALSNLLRNASRYAGDAGPIELSAARQNGHVRLFVADHGPGLPEEELDRVLAPFYRPEQARTRESGGVGLGLAIVKTCVAACHGTVRLRNRQPHGLEVEITLRAA